MFLFIIYVILKGLQTILSKQLIQRKREETIRAYTIWHFCISFRSVKGHTIVERFVCKYQWRISCVWQITNMVCTWAIIKTFRMQKLHLIHLVIFTLATIIFKDYSLNAKRRNRLHIFHFVTKYPCYDWNIGLASSITILKRASDKCIFKCT